MVQLGVGSTYSGAAGSWGSTYAIFGLTGGVKLTVTSGATWYVTGTQLEIGTSATPFERRLYGTELQLCQRYFYKTFGQTVAPANGTAYQSGIGAPSAVSYATGAVRYVSPFTQPMRTTPTITYYNNTIGGSPANGVWSYYLSNWTAATTTTNGECSDLYVAVDINKTLAFTVGYSYLVGGFFTASAEL